MKKKKNIICIVQARMSSIRLPGKSMMDIAGKPAIQRVIERIKRSKYLSNIWLACSSHKSDNILYEFALKHSFNCFRGSLDDVLSRYVSISNNNNADIVVRITGDCPLIDPEIVDQVIEIIIKNKCDYASNTLKRTYPDGLDVEVFTSQALYEADKFSSHGFMREHVTPYIHGRLVNQFPSGDFIRDQLLYKINYSNYRWTLDYREDLVFLNNIYENLDDNCGWQKVIELILKYPHLKNINKHINLNVKTEDSPIKFKS
tara:strand:+ start:270 stop:1046 length:777 start_codon:yes stop_codon:yes gene_type:complete